MVPGGKGVSIQVPRGQGEGKKGPKGFKGQAYKVPRGKRVGLYGPRGSRGGPTGSKGVKG